MLQNSRQKAVVPLRRPAVLIGPGILFAEMVALGADGPLLSALAYILQILGAIVIIGMLNPSSRFWRAMIWPMGALGLALLWLASGWWSGLDAAIGRHWIAPDMILPGCVALMASIGFFLGGALIGWRGGLCLSLDRWNMLGLLVCLIGLIIRLTGNDLVWGQSKGILVGRFTGTMLNANAAACLFGVLAVLAVGRCLSFLTERYAMPSIATGVVTWSTAIVALGACMLTGSRTASGAMITTIAVLAMTDANLSRATQRLWGGRKVIGGWALWLALVLLLLGAVLAITGDLLLQRLEHVNADGLNRLRMWSFYLDMVARQPLGYGPGSFEQATQAQLIQLSDAVQLWYVHAPHNAALSLLLIGGWPYLALVSLAGAAVVVALLRLGQWRYRPLMRSVSIALVFMLICAFDDIALDMPALLALFSYLAGMVYGHASQEWIDTRRKMR